MLGFEGHGVRLVEYGMLVPGIPSLFRHWRPILGLFLGEDLGNQAIILSFFNI